MFNSQPFHWHVRQSCRATVRSRAFYGHMLPDVTVGCSSLIVLDNMVFEAASVVLVLCGKADRRLLSQPGEDILFPSNAVG